MVVGEVGSSADVVVVGGGPGGYTAALRAAALGASVALVERRGAPGGVCLHEGCIPSKALLHVAHVVALPEAAAGWGVDMKASVDLRRTRRWITGVVERLAGGVSRQLGAAGVRILTGTARFSAARRVAVTDGAHTEHVEFTEAIVATGSRPLELPDLPFDGRRVLDSTAALALDVVPPRLAVVGGGYVGVELASAYGRLGSAVTLIEALPRLLPGMAEALGRALHRRLEADGVAVVTGASADHPAVAAADAVIVAVGRRPNTDGIGLEAVHITPDATGHLAVDASRRAGRHVLAVGDVTGGIALAHKAMAEAEVAARTACGQRAVYDPACVPAVVYTDPEIVSVGATEGQRRRVPLSSSGRALATGGGDGFVEVVADPQTGVVIGVHMVGAGVSELAGEAALAVEMGATAEDLALTVHPHPTLSEVISEAARQLTNREEPR